MLIILTTIFLFLRKIGNVREEKESATAALVWPTSNMYLPKKWGCQSCFFTCDDLWVMTEHVEKHVLTVPQQSARDPYHPVSRTRCSLRTDNLSELLVPAFKFTMMEDSIGYAPVLMLKAILRLVIDSLATGRTSGELDIQLAMLYGRSAGKMTVTFALIQQQRELVNCVLRNERDFVKFDFVRWSILEDCDYKKYPDHYYYSLIPTGIAIIVALSVIAGLLWCCCKKGTRNGDPVPKVTGYVERGAQPNPGSCSGSQESNQLESGETVNMLYFGPLDPVTPKITSPSKKYIRGASQTEELLKNTDDRFPDSSFPTQEVQLFESATSASSGGPLTHVAPPNFQLESGQLIYPSRYTTGETIKNNLYPLIPIPRTSTLPSPKPQPFDLSNDSPHCDSPYSQLQEKITTNSRSSHKRPSADVLEDDMPVKKSRNYLNFEESSSLVHQDTEKIINLGPRKQMGKNEGSNCKFYRE
ncbi:hypothetical protein LOD99_9546 [Oopsacas minuta]|uniref:C2H2-type domain-containing protein n=1 Tax=Oopsacas minuta TaxID=111878 RepID=A0AAV7JBS1_9METZ|nr:hypothetical protein LOD99_9546 [Oopsacas minuta]